MMTRYIALSLILIAFFAGSSSTGSDSTAVWHTVMDKFSFDLGFGAYHMASKPDHLYTNRIKVPDYLAKNNNHVYATDNPEYHGASYLEFQTIGDFSRDFKIYASLTCQHEGYSLGTYNTEKIAVFPRYQIIYTSTPDSNSFLPIATGITVGYFMDYRRFEGLRLYNIDVQGILAYVQYKKLRLSNFHIGDLHAGIGLNIDDYIDYMISLEDIGFWGRYAMDVRLGFVNYASYYNDLKNIDAVDFSIGVQKGENVRLYGELGYRFMDGGFDYRLKYASLLGIKYNAGHGRLNLNARTEYRHYGGMFNYRLKNIGYIYRTDGTSTNGIYYDRQIYPVNFLNRPFSQWAVFTEYHKPYIDGITFFATARYYVTGKHFLFAEMDFNGIKAKGEDFFLYPFFKLGFGFEPVKNVFAMAGISNKIMNLDKHYPTYYYLKDPLFTVELRRDINWPVI